MESVETKVRAAEGAEERSGGALPWVLSVLVSFVISFLVIPGLAARDLTWFLASWSDAAFVLVLLVRSVLLSTSCDYDKGGPATSDHFRALALMIVLLVAVYDRTAGQAAHNSAIWSMVGILLCVLAGVLDTLAVNGFRQADNPTFVTNNARVLVTSGVYGVIRHPIYVGLFLAALGLPLILRSLWAAGLVLVTVLPLLLIRIRWEEGRLLATFGDDYRAYAARTKRFIPYVI